VNWAQNQVIYLATLAIKQTMFNTGGGQPKSNYEKAVNMLVKNKILLRILG
jgi:hypothetical protein